MRIALGILLICVSLLFGRHVYRVFKRVEWPQPRIDFGEESHAQWWSLYGLQAEQQLSRA